MVTWRKLHERPLCLYYTKYDDILTGRRYNTKGEEFSLPDSEYADDTAVLFVSRESLVVTTPLLIAHFARFGLEIHVGHPNKLSKSEILFVAAPEHTYDDSSTYDGCDLSNVDLGNGCYLPVVDIFKYLGSILTRDCRDDADVDARISAASHAFGALRQCLFISTEVPLSAKKVPYRTKFRRTKFSADKIFRRTKFSAPSRNFGSFVRRKCLSAKLLFRILLNRNTFFYHVFYHQMWLE